MLGAVMPALADVGLDLDIKG